MKIKWNEINKNVKPAKKVNKKSSNKKINPLDYINTNNFYSLKKLIKLKRYGKVGNICYHENKMLVHIKI